MSWESELRETIDFISPNNDVFEALWKDNPRSFEKKLGVFNSPKFNGSIVQDLDSKSVSWPLTFFFQGADHHKTAEKFFDALFKQRGQWIVTHPVKGELILQLVSASEAISPVENGNYTGFTTQWIEPANLEFTVSAEQSLFGMLTELADLLQDALTGLRQLRSDAYAEVQSSINTFNKITGIMDTIVAEAAAFNAITNDAYESAKSAYLDALSRFDIDNSDPTETGEALSDTITTVSGSSDDFIPQFETYNDMAEDLYLLTPDTVTLEDYNIVVTQEYSIVVTLIAVLQSLSTSEFNSKSDVISAIENITSVFNNAINAMESAQNNFISLDIDRQFYFGIESYSRIAKSFSLSMRYLLTQFYDLKTEKRFTLKNPRSPIEITITEYGSMGDNDENYTLFLESNNLDGNEILLLPAGKEVVVYAA